ncbi:aspartate aminotransferase family protein [Paenirhodobacter populi]|uniref:Aspartate aminotransferase family protein n=1 Tax=Paenirhodobacter populi TaxID=2306993 RepID=A0A443IJM0_9RHOB|nr:aspartate aminotransferase family protein [Sinirhodobacter populi]RWR04547.1 aspartate aminotransferase family protein [Sinirhodobacter populi]
MTSDPRPNRTHILHRDPSRVLPVAVAGDGPFVIDSAGRRYLDASGGAAVSCLGHSEHRVIAAIKAQLDRLPYAHTSFFTSEPAEALADFLISRAPEGLEHVYFISGGSEANETALKLARQYFWEKGETGRRHFIARQQSYHGNTLGALSVGGNPARRAVYEPILLPVSHIPPCFDYRNRRADETSEEYGLRAANELETEILRLGPETVIAFIAETVGGATCGAITPAPGYFRRIREICDKYGVLLILDEVMCGMGRTGTLFACEQEGVSPDLLTCAKGLGAGYQPIGACLMSGEIYDAITQGSGTFQHGFTYIGHATACAGALAVQQVIEEDGLLRNCQAMGDALGAALRDRFGDHPHIGDIRGRGLFRAIELVEDRAAKRPFDLKLKLHAKIRAEAMAEGLMVYPGGGTIDGRSGDHVLMAPPYIITQAGVDMIATRLAAAVDRAVAAVMA